MSWYVVAYLGIAFMVLAVWLGVREHSWIVASQLAPGTVVALERVRGSKGGYSYKPRVRYVGADGVEREFTRAYSSNPVGFSVGEKIFVAYRLESNEARILTFGQRFGFATGLGVLGIALFCLAGTFIVGRNYVPDLYLESIAPRPPGHVKSF